MMLEPMGLAAGPVVPTREWRELYAALDCAVVAAIHPFYTASMREFEAAGRADRRLGAGRPRRHRGLAAGDRRGDQRRAGADRRGEEPLPARDPRRAGAACRSRAASRVSGYEGSELLVARLLVESGADLRYVGTACPRTPWSDADREWLEAQGRARAVPRLARAGPGGDARVPARPRDRHHAGGAGRQGSDASRRCTSPT